MTEESQDLGFHEELARVVKDHVVYTVDNAPGKGVMTPAFFEPGFLEKTRTAYSLQRYNPNSWRKKRGWTYGSRCCGDFVIPVATRLVGKTLGSDEVIRARTWLQKFIEDLPEDDAFSAEWKRMYELYQKDTTIQDYFNTTYVVMNMMDGSLRLQGYNPAGSPVYVSLAELPASKRKTTGEFLPRALMRAQEKRIPGLFNDEESRKIERTNVTITNAQALITALLQYISVHTSTLRQAVTTWERAAEYVKDKSGNRIYIGTKGRYPAIPFPIGISRELVNFAYSIYSLYKV